MVNEIVIFENELFKDIPYYEDLYQASTYGRIWSIKRQIFLKQCLEDNGSGHYRYKVGLYKGKECFRYLVSQLVAKTFIGLCPNGMEVCHNDGNQLNNKLDNLRYDTKKNNMKDFVIHTGGFRGEKNPYSVLKDEQVIEIVKRYKTGKYTHKSLAIEYGVSKSTISMILIGKNYSYLKLGRKYEKV